MKRARTSLIAFRPLYYEELSTPNACLFYPREEGKVSVKHTRIIWTSAPQTLQELACCGRTHVTINALWYFLSRRKCRGRDDSNTHMFMNTLIRLAQLRSIFRCAIAIKSYKIIVWYVPWDALRHAPEQVPLSDWPRVTKSLEGAQSLPH